MQNQIEINSDGINLYIVSKVRARKVGLIVLIVFNILFCIVLFLVLSQPDDNAELVKFKVFFCLIGIPIYVFTLGRYTAWNLWGEERIIINTKCVTYQYSYGIIEPKETTIQFKTLSLGLTTPIGITNDLKGEFILYDHDENNLPFEIFTSTVLIQSADLELISKEIDVLFINELYRNNKFIPYSIN